MDLLQALSQIPALVEEFQRVASELIEAKRELETLKNDGYVSWKWACDYFDMDEKTARKMLADEKMLVHNSKIKKFRKSDLIRFAERHSVRVRDLSKP